MIILLWFRGTLDICVGQAQTGGFYFESTVLCALTGQSVLGGLEAGGGSLICGIYLRGGLKFSTSAQLVECLSSMQEALRAVSLSQALNKPGVLEQCCGSSTQKIKVGRSEAPSHSPLGS